MILQDTIISMEFDEYPGWEVVSGDSRREPYWRRIAPNWQNPSPAQEDCRRKFAELASQTKGLTGTTPLPDGRVLSRSAVEISKALAPKNCIEPLRNDITESTETEPAAPHNESNSTYLPTETVFITPAEPSRMAPLISLYRDVEEIRAMKQREDEAVLQKFNSDLRTERERLKTNFEKSKAIIEERRRCNEVLIREFINAPHSKTDKVMRSRLQTQIELEDTIPPIPVPSVSSLPAIPDAHPTNPVTDDFNPLSFLGWTLGAVSIASLIAWGLKSKNNMATVLDIVHLTNTALNPGRPPPFNKL